MGERNNKNYDKFPVLLREKLKASYIVFPEEVLFDYEPIKAFRCITRKVGDDAEINEDDFKSNAEKPNRKYRGKEAEFDKNPKFYGVSLFSEKTPLINIMKLPKPRKKLICGNVCCENGPCLIEDKHICWWLYESKVIEGFELVE